MNLKRNNSKVKPSRRWMIISLIITVCIVLILTWGHKYYQWIYRANVVLPQEKDYFLYIPDKAEFNQVIDLIKRENVLKDINSFIWLSKMKGYGGKIKGGRYRITTGMNNNELINLLRSGRQTPVKFTFNNIRTRYDLAGVVGHKLEADSSSIVRLLSDNQFLNQFQLNQENAAVMFIPNTYEIYWNTSPEAFIKRMKHEYDEFWNEDRIRKADSIGLTQTEVSILASIVDEETIREKEKPLVAGLYLNRLRKGIRLQADPTVKFANGNFQVNRVLTCDLEIDSPYNTYKYAGLPPGPIRIPSISGIESVLNADNHQYLYMCAKEDFSGYHNFAVTLAQHNRNAAKYRKALKQRRIWR